MNNYALFGKLIEKLALLMKEAPKKFTNELLIDMIKQTDEASHASHKNTQSADIVKEKQLLEGMQPDIQAAIDSHLLSNLHGSQLDEQELLDTTLQRRYPPAKRTRTTGGNAKARTSTKTSTKTSKKTSKNE